MTTNFQITEFLCHCCGDGADIVKPELLEKLQLVRNEFGFPMVINCGYRCPRHNAAVGGAPDSAHLIGEAADISDPDLRLVAFCTEARLAEWGLWMEAPAYSAGWAHLQIRPEMHRIFIP